jgi:hypothetical protein
MRLHLDRALFNDLLAYLDTNRERVAFLRTTPAGHGCRVSDVRRLDDHTDYLDQRVDGAELADHVRPAVLRWAHDNDSGLAEAHWHGRPGPSTAFSRTDHDGLRQLAPHVLWRLPGRPYVALVLGPDSFDAMVWFRPHETTPLDAMVVGDIVHLPTGLSRDRAPRKPA